MRKPGIFERMKVVENDEIFTREFKIVTKFDVYTTTEDVIRGVDLKGKTAVVTGASAGLGVETARTLAVAGANTILLGRNRQKLTNAADGIRQQHPDVNIQTVIMDLADQSSVREAAAEILSSHPTIDLLINNAGVMACPFSKTVQGLELQFGTNHIGHFLFTCLLIPALLNADQARIINLSSAGHKNGEVDLQDYNFEKRSYDKWVSYGQAKTANVQFTVALSERLLDKGVRCFAVHPGAIKTELGRHMTEEDARSLAKTATTSEGWIYKTVAGGAATSVWAATSEDLNNHSGIYLEDCQIAEPVHDGSSGGYAAYAVDSDKSNKLWALSEKIVGQRFTF